MANVKIDKLVSLRMSRKIGRLDGREGLPDLSVTTPHSPFLAELKNIGEQHFSKVSESRTESLSSLDDALGKNSANQAALEQRMSDINRDIATHEDELNRIKDDYRGNESDSVSSRVADKRYIEGFVYFIIVFVTIVGEVVITYPAFTELFQDTIFVAVIATIAASAMTISYSHILGLTLKRNDDKKRRQPRWVMPTLLIASIPILGLIATLSNVRAKKFADEPPTDSSSSLPEDSLGNLTESSELGVDPSSNSSEGLDVNDDSTDLSNIPGEEIFTPGDTEFLGSPPLTFLAVFALFAFLQLALVAVATFASYHHFSNSLSEVKRISGEIKKLRKKISIAIIEKTKLEKSLENAENKKKKIFESHKAQILNIERKVRARSQAFWGANIRQRSDSPLAKSREFPPPHLDLPDWM